MKAFFHDLLRYNNHYNNEIIEVLGKNPEIISDKCIKLISHILNAHRIWNYRIKEGENLYERWAEHTVHECYEINKKNYEDSVLILDALNLEQNIQYAMSTGQTFNNSVQDILFHVINHSTYHRAQIATEFRQIGLEPLLTDYIVYKIKM